MTFEIPIDDKIYVAAPDAARQLGVSTDYVARLARTGRIPARRLGYNWYIERDAVLPRAD